MWYDWAYVHFEEINFSGDAVENYYPSKILGFIIISGTTEAVIQCSEKQLIWSDLENKFFVKTIIGTDMMYHVLLLQYLCWYIHYVLSQIMVDINRPI
jgi:hypothetical protein